MVKDQFCRTTVTHLIVTNGHAFNHDKLFSQTSGCDKWSSHISDCDNWSIHMADCDKWSPVARLVMTNGPFWHLIVTNGLQSQVWVWQITISPQWDDKQDSVKAFCSKWMILFKKTEFVWVWLCQKVVFTDKANAKRLSLLRYWLVLKTIWDYFNGRLTLIEWFFHNSDRNLESESCTIQMLAGNFLQLSPCLSSLSHSVSLPTFWSLWLFNTVQSGYIASALIG